MNDDGFLSNTAYSDKCAICRNFSRINRRKNGPDSDTFLCTHSHAGPDRNACVAGAEYVVGIVHNLLRVLRTIALRLWASS